MLVLRSVKCVCRDSTWPSLTGTAAQMSGSLPVWSATYVARRPCSTFSRSSKGSSGSSILMPGKFGRPDSSKLRWAIWTRSSARSRALSSIDTRAALCTTRLSATATSAPTSAMAALSFHLSPVRMSARSRRWGSRRREIPGMTAPLRP